VERILGPIKPGLYVALRVVSGVLFSVHGFQKMFGIIGGRQVELVSQLGLASVIEIVGGLSIALGVFTSPWAFVASGEMAVAYFQQHMPRGLWPVLNGGEPTVLYCFVFLYIAANGSGKWSLRK
jgi:putative oxidoreductase